MGQAVTNCVIGVDVGTQSTKALLMTPQGRILAQASAGYQVESPRQKWAQQWPDVWFQAVCQTIAQCVREAGVAAANIKGICIS
ncbi:MAG: FGGY family carbohydrate kinase, partial [Enterobacteriaceae bacterium]